MEEGKKVLASFEEPSPSTHLLSIQSGTFRFSIIHGTELYSWDA
jgi:hypothetical protein